MAAGVVIIIRAMNANSEELYLEAEAGIKNNNYAEAFSKYESILYEEPDSAPARREDIIKKGGYKKTSTPLQSALFTPN